MSGLRQAAAFLSAFGGASAPTPAALRWFPVVGAGIGALLGGVWVLGARAWPVLVAAAVVVVADLVVTGMLHLDGLVDAADGLLPHLDTDKRLAVMAEPDVGAFGATTVAAVLLLRVVALAAVVPDARLLAALWCLSRTLMAATAAFGRYARTRTGGGLATAFVPARRGGAAAWVGAGVAASVALALWWRPAAGAAALAAAAVAAVAVVALAYRRIGGFTGDVLGAAGVVSETAGLLVAAGRW